MVITIGGKEVELKYTYHSFRYMEELDIEELMSLDKKPFKLIRISENLLLGAVNNDPKQVIKYEDVSKYIQNEFENGNINDLLESLMVLLEESSFFQNLQKNSPEE